MAFQLNSVVPWGRNMEEYQAMFQLDDDVNKKIASFGDGPASFNYEASQRGYSVTSFDPIYQFSKSDLRRRIEEVRTKEYSVHYGNAQGVQGSKDISSGRLRFSENKLDRGSH